MKNTLLLVIDFINEITHLEGKGSTTVVPHLIQQQAMKHANEAIAFARKHNILVAHVKIGFKSDYADHPLDSPIFGEAAQSQAFQLGTWGTQFHDEMDVQADDKIIVKNRISPFYNTDLEKYLKERNIKRLILCGVSTQWAVESAAKDAHDRDYEVVILANACASSDEANHQHVLANMRRIAQVINVDDLANVIK